MSKDERWRNSIYAKMAQEEAVTYLPNGNQKTTPPEDQPNYDVYALELQKNKDKGKPLIIYGNEITIPTQISLLKALDMYYEYRGINLTFETWWEYWENGFSYAINRTGTPGLITNYPIKDRTNPDGSVTPAFRKNKDERPGYLELKNPNVKNNPLFRTIEYWPNRNDQTTSVIFCGSDADIINHITRYHSSAQGTGGTIDDNGVWTGESPLMGKHPMVTLYFAASELLPGHKMPTRSRISFRLMDKTESIEYAFSGESVLTQTDVNQLIQKIKTKYVSIRYKLERGDILFSYTHREAGYSFWNPLRSRQEAIRIYGDVLSLQGHTLKAELIKESSTPARASSIPDKKIMVLGEEQTVRVGFKNEDLYFTHAILHLPISRQRKTLAVSQVAEKIT